MLSATRLWDREFSELQVIPSSTRNAPAKALVLFSELLGFRGMKRALDAGCGNGRNSLYLAEMGLHVDAVDFSQAAIHATEERCKKAGVQGKVMLHEHNFQRPLPFEGDSFDLSLDFYVLCHFLDEETKQRYISELFRVTEPNGYLISALFAPSDEYYARLVGQESNPRVVVDPANGIAKQLYTKNEFRSIFTPSFIVEYLIEFEFEDIVRGKVYRRDILAMALRKPGSTSGPRGNSGEARE